MSEENDPLAQEKELLTSVENASTSEKIKTYTKLSGPGWLQGAITLGGGSLAGSLYLGVIGGTQLLWLQPLMMIFGVLMLSVIGYVTLSTGKSPFQAINQHINPVLGWGWLIAAMLANLVWAMPQFSLGTAALQQNLGLFNGENGDLLCALVLFSIATVVVWMYDSKGVKAFEMILKILVGIIVLSFFGVVVVMAGELNWGSIAKGFIPDFSLLSQPADKFAGFIAASSAPDYWNNVILDSQRDRMVTAAATAVGINMTFLLPYSMLRKGWGKEHRGLASFDLGMGLFIPFFLATTCVVIASANQFHGKYDEGLLNTERGHGTNREIAGSLRKESRRNPNAPRRDGIAQSSGPPTRRDARQSRCLSTRRFAGKTHRQQSRFPNHLRHRRGRDGGFHHYHFDAHQRILPHRSAGRENERRRSPRRLIATRHHRRAWISVPLEQRRRKILAGRAHQYFRDGAAANCVLHFFLHDQ